MGILVHIRLYCDVILSGVFLSSLCAFYNIVYHWLGQCDGERYNMKILRHKTSLFQSEASALAEYCIGAGYQAVFDSITILSKASGFWERVIGESLEIAL